MFKKQNKTKQKKKSWAQKSVVVIPAWEVEAGRSLGLTGQAAANQKVPGLIIDCVSKKKKDREQLGTHLCLTHTHIHVHTLASYVFMWERFPCGHGFKTQRNDNTGR